jgi:N-acetylglucosaminyldiphosphoundecaprenol N-acetyl-beta-D-mannosaminyltransferase
MDVTVARCLEWCEGPRVSHTVMTVNAALLIMMRKDPALREACVRGDLIVADGMPVVWTSKLAGTPLAERVAGADLMPNLLRAASDRGLRVYFLGAKRAVVDALLAICQRDYPGLVVAGARDGYFGPADHEAIVEEIRTAAPHMLFVGMPSPFKEVWCERHRDRLEVPVILGVGGTFDVLTGTVKRAPRFLQSIGMEWSWRLMMEPRKMWKRYLTTNTEFIWTAGREALARRLGASSS